MALKWRTSDTGQGCLGSAHALDQALCKRFAGELPVVNGYRRRSGPGFELGFLAGAGVSNCRPL